MLQGDQIRLFVLFPAEKDDDTIQGETDTVALVEKPQYEAVSYRWGDPNDTEIILLSGQPSHVTTVLHAALRRLRLQDKPRLLWIDQLCIDQDNNEEKINQVRMMKNIYQSCSQCLIWFGEVQEHVKLEDAHAAVELIKYLANEVENPVALRSDDDFARIMKAIKSISVCSQPWWERVWTLQEAVLPERKVIVWGSEKFSWAYLSPFRSGWFTREYHLRLSEYKKSDHRDYLHEIFLYALWTNGTFQPYPSGLLRLILIWRQKRDATNPKDKVFGYTGLFERGSMPYIEACNYETPVATLYSATTLDLIANNGLLPLMMNPRLEKERRTPDMPSWAMDLKAIPYYDTGHWFTYWGHGSYDACAGRPLDVEWLREVAATSGGRYNVLGLRGMHVDRVKVTSTDRILDHWPDIVNTQSVFSCIQRWLALAQAQTSSLNSPDGLRALFGLVMLQGLVRTHDHWVLREGTQQDGRDVSLAIETSTFDKSIWYEERSVHMPVSNRTFFITENGHLGIGQMETEVGDEVWIFDGGNLPFLLRNQQVESNEYDFVGCCYVQGFAKGEALKETKGEERIKRVRIH